MKKAMAAMEAALATGLSSSPAAARKHPSAFEWVQARDDAMFRLQSEAMMLWKEIVSGKARLQSLAGQPAGNTAMEAEKLFLQECQLWCGLGLPFSHLWGHGACGACGFQRMLQDALSRGKDGASMTAVGCAGGEDEVEMKDAINGFVKEPIHRENQEPFEPEGWASSSPSPRELLWMAGGDGGDEDFEYFDQCYTNALQAATADAECGCRCVGPRTLELLEQEPLRPHLAPTPFTLALRGLLCQVPSPRLVLAMAGLLAALAFSLRPWTDNRVLLPDMRHRRLDLGASPWKLSQAAPAQDLCLYQAAKETVHFATQAHASQWRCQVQASCPGFPRV